MVIPIPLFLKNLKYPLNSAEHDFGIIFETGAANRGFFTSNRDGGKGRDDLYSFNLPDILFSLDVYVTNKETNLPVPGVTITLLSNEGNQVVKTTDAEGKFSFDEENRKRFIEKETLYNIEVVKDSFLMAKHHITTVGATKSKKFIEEVYSIGVNYLGLCCGASPMLIREVANAIGRKVPASKFNEKMSNHFMYGSNERIPGHSKDYGSNA